jgi:hypothetical protein
VGGYWNRTGTAEVDLVGGVPGAGEGTLLLGVSSQGFDDAPLDTRLTPEDLIAPASTSFAASADSPSSFRAVE